jgi:uncharacterized protein with HEPN domain
MNESDRTHVQDMVEYVGRVSRYVEGLDRDRLAEDTLVQDALARALTVVSCAAGRVSDSCRVAYPDIPWRELAALREVILHDDVEVDLDTLWSAANQDVPELLPALERMIT